MNTDPNDPIGRAFNILSKPPAHIYPSPTDPPNQYRLLVKREPDGTEKQAVEVRLEVPDGFCWKDLGQQMLSFGMRYIADHSTNSDETSRIPLWKKVFPKANQEI